MAVTALFGSGNSTTAALASTATITANKPGNTADGDLLVALVYSQSGGATTTIPAGWTLIAGTTFTQRAGGFYTKPIPNAANETATNYTWAFSVTGRMTTQIFRVTGANTTNPIDAVGAVATQGAANTTLPSVTATTTALLIAGAYWNNSTTTPSTFTPDPSMTDGQQIATPSTANTSGTGIAWQQANAGPTGTRTFTTSPASANTAGVMFTIAPAPTAASGTLTLSAAGTLALSGSAGTSGALTLAGTGALDATGTPGTNGALNHDGAGTLALDGQPATTDTLNLDGFGTLTLSGTKQGPAANVTITAALDERLWRASMTSRVKAAQLQPRRWAGTL